jgi:hypothetical protein
LYGALLHSWRSGQYAANGSSPCLPRYNATGTGSDGTILASRTRRTSFSFVSAQLPALLLFAPMLRAWQARQEPGRAEGSESAGSPQLAGYFFSLAGGVSN